MKGRSVTALLDTGSWLSLVSLQMDRNLCIPMRSTHEDHCILKSACRDFLNVFGKGTLDLFVNHLSMSRDFDVIENLTLNAFIDCDFMYKFNVVISFVTRTVSFMGCFACEQLRNRSNELKETVRTINFVT